MAAKDADDNANKYIKDGKYALAEEESRKAVVIMRNVQPPQDAEIARYLFTLGISLYDQNRFADAEPVFREGLLIVRAGVPSGDLRLKVWISDLAITLWNENKQTEAEPLYRELLQIERAQHPAALQVGDSAVLEVANTLNSLALTGKRACQFGWGTRHNRLSEMILTTKKACFCISYSGTTLW